MAEITVSQLDMANSRILTVGSSIDKALDLISRIQRLSKSSDISETEPSDSPSASSSKVPWTISNKYYSADVHFAAHSIKGLAPYHVQNVPAVLFVWSKGEEYRSHILRLAQDLEGYEPEVVLAVRTHTSADIPVEDQLNDEEEEGEVDEFLSDHGFEFVDAIEENLPATVHGEGRTFSQGIPTLPRVLDALSTIMWPNMKQPSKQSGGYRGLGALLDLTPGSREDSLASIDSLVTRPGDSSEQQNRRQKEMEALERWLEDDVRDERGQDPWKINSEKAGLVHSPVEGTHNIPNPSSSSPKAELAFDDDFSVFVSAPPAESGIAKHGDDISFSSPMFSENDSGLKAAPLGELYHSLGSTSDLGDMDPHSPISPLPSSSSKPPPTAHDDDSDSEGLPSAEEIHQTSTRLFGSADRAASFGESFDFDNPEYEMAPFDLSHVMSALQVMKSEISNMQDEGERRKAAASVALSLVYGLEEQPAS